MGLSALQVPLHAQVVALADPIQVALQAETSHPLDLLFHLELQGPLRCPPGRKLSESGRCHTCRRRAQLTLGDRRDAQEPCRAILGRVLAPAPFSCPFWLADTAGWKNSVGMGRSGLEGAAGEGGEGAGEQAQAGREGDLTSRLWDYGQVSLSEPRCPHYESKRNGESARVIPGRTGARQRHSFWSQADPAPGPLGSCLYETGTRCLP